MSQKVVSFGKKAAHCSGALLKKRKCVSPYFLDGYRYHKNVNRFEFQTQKAIFQKKKSKFFDEKKVQIVKN